MTKRYWHLSFQWIPASSCACAVHPALQQRYLAAEPADFLPHHWAASFSASVARHQKRRPLWSMSSSPFQKASSRNRPAILVCPWRPETYNLLHSGMKKPSSTIEKSFRFFLPSCAERNSLQSPLLSPSPRVSHFFPENGMPYRQRFPPARNQVFFTNLSL